MGYQIEAHCREFGGILTNFQFFIKLLGVL